MACVSAFALSACGGGGERQDEDEPEGDFPVTVTNAQFPNRQIPNLAVTIFVDDGGGAVSSGAG